MATLAGKLFPGPHLYAGAGIVALWAVAASLVPAMQRGNDGARTLHITLNCINIGLFAWQVTPWEVTEATAPSKNGVSMALPCH